MKVYQVGSGGIWIGILVFGLIILSMLSIGGFLLGTPIGWAILTVLVIRHFYRRHQRRKNFEAYSRAYENGDNPYSSPYRDSTGYENKAAEGENSGYGEASDFASAYRQEDGEIKVFSSEDKNSAMDVEFKEI